MEEKRSVRGEDGELDESLRLKAPLATAASRPMSRSRLAQGTGSLEEHQVLVSAALVEEQEAAERALGLRALPPARFRRPVRLDNRAAVFRPPPLRPHSRVALALFSGALALTSVAIASWNAYWLAAPLREAIGAFMG